jgi:hypothetical protein
MDNLHVRDRSFMPDVDKLADIEESNEKKRLSVSQLTDKRPSDTLKPEMVQRTWNVSDTARMARYVPKFRPRRNNLARLTGSQINYTTKAAAAKQQTALLQQQQQDQSTFLPATTDERDGEPMASAAKLTSTDEGIPEECVVLLSADGSHKPSLQQQQQPLLAKQVNGESGDHGVEACVVVINGADDSHNRSLSQKSRGHLKRQDGVAKEESKL